jgi:soluble lytic murein transglycosylase-like protein
MKMLPTILPALILAASVQAAAQSFSQLSGSTGVEAAAVPMPSATPEAAEVTDNGATGADFVFRTEAAHEAGAQTFAPWASMSKAAGDGKPNIPYLALAKAEAEAQGVELALVLAIIQKESSFDPKARSSVGAVGLMQLMPDTAKWLGLKNTAQLTTPAVNIKYGVKYLKYLWGEFAEAAPANITGEDLNKKTSQMAIAAYNAGQGNVRKYDGVPPFKETKNYVTKVTEYFRLYEDLLAEKVASIL